MGSTSSIASKSSQWVFYALLATYLIAAGLATYAEFYWLWALPIVVGIVGVALFKMDWLLLAIVFFVPLSQNLEKLEFGLGVYLPTEPLMFGAMLVFGVRLFFDGNYDRRILSYPLTLAVVANLLWIFLTVIPSELPLVSLKFLIMRLWFIVPFFFMAVLLFKNTKNIDRLFWFYIIPMAGVIIYTVYNHAIRGFEEKPAHWVMQPFFKDHTSYGAMIAYFMPMMVCYLALPKLRITSKIQVFLILLVFTVGVIFSYTRAAWVSLLGAFLVWLVIYFKVHLKYLIVLAGICLFLFINLQDQIFMKLEKNRQDSSSDLSEHVESISNVATDASNLERINRWSAAFRMWEERPVFGHGPGTYAFLYAPYQHSSQLTIISTNFGDGGNAHSEYFGPLAETGVLGLVTFIAIVFFFYFKAIPLFYELEDTRLKYLLMGAILGQTTYLIHGVLNNFLDTDKASVPFWASMALVVSLDLYQKKISKSEYSK